MGSLGPAAPQVFDFFRQRYGPAVAAGIVGNTQQESSNNPNAPGGGLIQGQGGRTSSGSLQQQLMGVLHELEGPERGTLQALRGARDPKTAARIFSQRFERAGVPMLSQRERYAEEALQQFGHVADGQHVPGATEGSQSAAGGRVAGPSGSQLQSILGLVEQLQGPKGSSTSVQGLSVPKPGAAFSSEGGPKVPRELPQSQGANPSDLMALLAKMAPEAVQQGQRGQGQLSEGGGEQVKPGAGKYGALLAGGLKYAGPDQGVDATGTGHLRAPADLEITKVDMHSGWPGGGLIVGKIKSGPERGRFIYFAEAVKPARGVKVGAVIRQGSAVAHVNSPYPGSETGFAQDASGTAYGTTHDGKPGGPAAQYGQEFERYLARAAGR